MRYFSRGLPAFFCLLALVIVYGCGGTATARQAQTPPAGTLLLAQGPATPAAPTETTGAGPDSASAEGVPVSAVPAIPAGQASAYPPPEAPDTAAAQVLAAMTHPATYTEPVLECWLPLLERLRSDPNVRPEMLRYFHGLPAYSPAPMGVKIKELFTNAFLRKRPPDDGRPRPPSTRIYRNVVTAAVVQRCNDYLIRHKDIFDAVEAKYPVPREILVALLFVETRLGTYVGRNLAIWSLASMAAADTPERMAGGLSGIPIKAEHQEWLKKRLIERSRWGYNELVALLDYCDTHGFDPFQIPGSVFGAIGISQFIPSNLVPYGENADGSGVVNLFSVPDAIFSSARYLTEHGWTDNMTLDQQRVVLRRYNNLTVYANTILALAESVRTGKLLTGPPDRPVLMRKRD